MAANPAARAMVVNRRICLPQNSSFKETPRRNGGSVFDMAMARPFRNVWNAAPAEAAQPETPWDL
jgi:hypothetical protein